MKRIKIGFELSPGAFSEALFLQAVKAANESTPRVTNYS